MAQVPAHSHQDDIGWPSVTREGRRGPNGEVSFTVSTGEALATLAVMAITCDGGL
jgi:hypothetical protein